MRHNAKHFLVSKYVSLTCLLLLFSATGSAGGQPSLIALFGDSISYGYNQSFPDTQSGMGRLNRGVPSIYLDQVLRDNQRTSLVSNLGVGGSASGPSANPLLSSNNGVQRIESDLGNISSLYSTAKAHYVLIIYGTNDYAYGISASTTGFNIGLLIESAINQGFIPVVGTLPPCSCNDVRPINSQIKSTVLAKQSQGKKVYLVDHYANLVTNWASLSDPDGVHPTNNGYREIANYWFENRLSSLISADPINITPIIMMILDD